MSSRTYRFRNTKTRMTNPDSILYIYLERAQKQEGLIINGKVNKIHLYAFIRALDTFNIHC